MRREETISLLRQHRAEIAAHGVRALYLFGSTRRDEARPDSDVDLFIDYADAFLCSIWWLLRKRSTGCSGRVSTSRPGSACIPGCATTFCARQSGFSDDQNDPRAD
jgi:hypothetical protein